MKYRIGATVIFILGLLAMVYFMNQDEAPVAPPQAPTQQTAPAQPANDPFRNLKIP